ncbi:MAG: hypothetical protein M1840_002939 [Geoglossum simile]|nr:MAG: hypothetical protein M1840_002939 [Geoglossum simile]
MLRVLVSIALLLQLTTAHYSIQYPYWRGNSFATQYQRPCGGVNQSLSDSNRTDWPIDGGSVSITPGHPWAITYVNLGLGGSNTTVFNISLIHGFNQTGNGTFCIPKIPISSKLGIQDGQTATIQVIQISETGSSLYNCADITFRKNATIFDKCANSTGVGGKAFESTGTCPAPSGNSSNQTGSATNTGPQNLYPYVAVFVASALVMFAYNM